jgi:hypothetical protein
MQNAIDDLLTYIGCGNRSIAIATLIDTIGEKNTRVITMQILNWLASQYRFGHDRPMNLNQRFPWCQALPQFLVLLDLGRILVIQDGLLSFSDSTPDDMRNAIRAHVAKEYRPVIKS